MRLQLATASRRSARKPRATSPRAPSRQRSSPERRTRTRRCGSAARATTAYVSQSNSVDSDATALNINLTKQDADQDQRGGDCRCGSDGIQAIGQEAKNDQSAAAASLAAQSGGRDRCGCGSSGNTNTPVRVDSKGDGGYGPAVEQRRLRRDGREPERVEAGRGSGSGGSGTQAIGQEAKNEQAAIALSGAFQHGASQQQHAGPGRQQG